jgi:pyrroline-5-carboxylate reductase
MKEQPIITFIGGGSMTYSLVSGLIAHGYEPERLRVSNPSAEKLRRFSELSVATYNDNRAAASLADVIVLAVKPKQIKEVCEELKEVIQPFKPLVISVAAGITIPSLQSALGEFVAVVRAMPNTPSAVQAGATGLYAAPQVSLAQRNLAEVIMRAVGIVVWVKEEAQMNAVAALSGSGPAYIFLIMEALQAAAEKLGLSTEDAHLLTVQTVLGAARMALETGADVAKLRQAVTSKGGMTEQAINVLEGGGIRGVFEEALVAATTRAKELGSSDSPSHTVL